MKKILLFLLFLGNWCFAQQQNATFQITPAVFGEDDEITITVSNIDLSTWGVADIYLWAWSYDLNDENSQDSPTNGSWTNSDESQRFTNNGDGTYSFTMTPSTLYQRTGIGRIGMLVKAKNGDGDKKSQDSYSEVGAFQVTLNAPSQKLTILNSGDNLPINATISINSDVTLKANGVQVDTQTSITNYAFNYTVNENTSFVLDITNDGTTISETFQAVITPTITEAPVPGGLKDGINLDPSDATKATLVLFAPDKNFIHVIGDFNSWQIDNNYVMNKDTANNRFWIELTGLTPQGNHMYQYLVDFDIRIADPYSTIILDETEDQFINAITFPDLPTYPTGNTNHAVTLLRTGDPEFNWQITNFQKPEKTDLVIYELLIRDFDELHSFDAVKARLDYLETLGINTIELMPVSEFDGNLSWGYNPSFHMALDKYYGTPEAFKQFIDACHARGIAVILDVVYNHATGQNPYYRMWNDSNGGSGGQASVDSPFFNQSATHDFSVFNDFNHSQQATKDYVKRTTQYWIDEYKIDGFRWDLTKGFTQNCTGSFDCTQGDNLALIQDRIDVLKLYADYQWESDPNFYVIFEHLGRIEEEKQWADYRANEDKGIMLWNKLTDPYNESTLGYHDSGKSNFSNVSYINKGFDGPSSVSYMESHDEQRLMYKNLEFGNNNGSYSVKNLNTALKRMETAGAFFFTVPGPKMIWQFGELGYEVSIDFNGRTGDKPIRWEYFDDPNRKAIYNTWADLINLKLNEPIFKTPNFSVDAASSTGLKTVHLTLDSATGDDIKYVTVIGNFGVTSQSITPDFQETGVWYEFLNGNLKHSVTDASSPISLEPGEFRIFGNNPSSLFPDNNIPDDDNDGVTNANDLCPNTPLGTVVDVDGCEVFTLPSNNFILQILSETCRSSNNGVINVTTVANLDYSITITGNNVNITGDFNTTYQANNLEAGDYTVCFTVAGQADYEQCF